MSAYVAALFLIAVCARKSQGLHVDLSGNLPSTLYYHGGNCTWRLHGIVAGHDFVFSAPHTVLENLDSGVEVFCEVNETELLHAVIITHQTLPPPHNVTLDTVNKRLEWDHLFLPQLPPLFELVHGFTITYRVYGKESGVPSLSEEFEVTSNYLDFTTESVKHCKEYDFMVQAVSNASESPSRNSSVVSGNFSIGAPSFRNLSATVQPIQWQQLYIAIHVNVTFVLEEKDCPGTHPTFLIVILEGTHAGEHKLDINSTHIEDGGGEFLIQLDTPVHNPCDLYGRIFGGNDAGNCTPCEMEHSRAKCSSVVTPTRTTSTIVGTSSPVPPPPDFSDENISSAGISVFVVTGLIIMGLILVVAIVPLLVVILLKRKRDTILPHKTEDNEYVSPAHITSDETSGNVGHFKVFEPTTPIHPQVSLFDQEQVPEEFPGSLYANDVPPTDITHERSPSKAKFTLSQGNVTYTEVSPIPNKPVPSYDNPTTGYATIDHEKTQEMAQETRCVSDGQNTAAVSQCAGPVPIPEETLTASQIEQQRNGLSLSNLDGLLVILQALGPKWYELGTQLKLSETLLDETQTNIDTDLQCLHEILSNWLNFHEPSLEKLNYALSEMDEPILLYDANNREFAVQSDPPPDLPPRCSL